MPPTFILSCGFLPRLTNSVSGSFFGSKVFLFPIIITTITSLSAAVVVSQVFGRIRSTGKFLRLLIQFSLWFTSSGGIGLYLTTKVIHMYKYCKQLKEPGGQQCHLGRKKSWTSRIGKNPMRRVLDKFLATSRLFHLYFDTEFRIYVQQSPNNLKSKRSNSSLHTYKEIQTTNLVGPFAGINGQSTVPPLCSPLI